MAQGSDRKGDSPGTNKANAAPGIDEETKDNLPAAPVVETTDGRPREATVAILLMLATAVIALVLSVYWMFLGSNPLGGLIIILLAVAYLSGGRALNAGESWGWGAGVFAGIFYVLFGFLLLPFGGILIGLAIVVIVLLYRVREYFGMVRYDADEEGLKKKSFEAERTSNPEGLHCPHCGSTRLWVAPDGSAFCQNCRAGTISLKRSA